MLRLAARRSKLRFIHALILPVEKSKWIVISQLEICRYNDINNLTMCDVLCSTSSFPIHVANVHANPLYSKVSSGLILCFPV